MTPQDTNAPDDWGTLANRLDEEYPKSWRPRWRGKDGKLPKADVDADEIMGTVIRIDRSAVEFGGKRRLVPIVILATHPEGELRSVWGVHSVLADELDRQEVAAGDRLAVRYLGKTPTQDGTGEYHAYKLALQRAAAPTSAPADEPPAEHPFGDEPPY